MNCARMLVSVVRSPCGCKTILMQQPPLNSEHEASTATGVDVRYTWPCGLAALPRSQGAWAERSAAVINASVRDDEARSRQRSRSWQRTQIRRRRRVREGQVGRSGYQAEPPRRRLQVGGQDGTYRVGGRIERYHGPRGDRDGSIRIERSFVLDRGERHVGVTDRWYPRQLRPAQPQGCEQRLERREHRNDQRVAAPTAGRAQADLPQVRGWNEGRHTRSVGPPRVARRVTSFNTCCRTGHEGESISKHLFERAGRPRIPRRDEFTSLEGVSSNASSGVWQSITIRGSWEASTEAGPAPDKGLDVWNGPLTLVWNAKAGTSRVLKLRLRTHYQSPLSSHKRQPEEYVLTNPQVWRTVTLVRRRTLVGHQVRWVYDAHLGVAVEPFRPADRYMSPMTGRRVGLDLGVSSLGIVTVDTTGVTSAELITPSWEDKTRRKDARLVARRRARALEHSRRANNPDAYNKGKNGNPNAGSRKVGTRLISSNKYKKIRTAQADTARGRAQDRKRRINELAKHIITKDGSNVTTEKITVNSWTRLWGGSVGDFAPATLMKAIQREVERAGGTWTEVNTYTTALSQHCVCGRREPKPLKQRTHDCPSGEGIRIGERLTSRNLILHDDLSRAQTLADHRH